MPASIPQIIGLLAVAAFLLSYQQRKRSNIILLNVISRILYILQYILLGAYAGAILDVLGAVSAALAGQKHRPFIKKNQKLLFAGVNVLIIAAGLWLAVARKSFLDVLPIIGVLLHTNAFWISSERIIRRISLAGSPFWLVYNLASRAYGSAVGDLLSMGSIVIAMIKYRNEQPSEE